MLADYLSAKKEKSIFDKANIANKINNRRIEYTQ